MIGGWEQKKKVVFLAAMGAVALAAVLYSVLATKAEYGGGSLPPPPAAAPAGASAPVPASLAAPAPVETGGDAAAATAPPAQPAGPTDPTLHLDVLAELRSIRYGDAGTGRDLFHFGATPPPKVADPVRGGRGVPAAVKPAVPAGPPPPPPIPLKFYGYATGDGPVQVFLQDGGDAYVVTEGQLVDHRYLIEKIEKLSVLVKDTQTSQEQQLPLILQPPGRGSPQAGNTR